MHQTTSSIISQSLSSVLELRHNFYYLPEDCKYALPRLRRAHRVWRKHPRGIFGTSRGWRKDDFMLDSKRSGEGKRNMACIRNLWLDSCYFVSTSHFQYASLIMTLDMTLCFRFMQTGTTSQPDSVNLDVRTRFSQKCCLWIQWRYTHSQRL